MIEGSSARSRQHSPAARSSGAVFTAVSSLRPKLPEPPYQPGLEVTLALALSLSLSLSLSLPPSLARSLASLPLLYSRSNHRLSILLVRNPDLTPLTVPPVRYNHGARLCSVRCNHGARLCSVALPNVGCGWHPTRESTPYDAQRQEAATPGTAAATTTLSRHSAATWPPLKKISSEDFRRRQCRAWCQGTGRCWTT